VILRLFVWLITHHSRLLISRLGLITHTSSE
jgi:hypothetical protein